MRTTQKPPVHVEEAILPPRVRRYRAQPEREGRISVSSAAIYIAVAGLITAVGLLYLIQTNHVASLGFEMSQLQRERETLALRNEQLNYAIAGYESLGTVEEIAVGQLGMQEAEDYIFLAVPRPANPELTLPEPLEVGNTSLLARIWDRMTGSGTAVAVTPEGLP